MKSSRPVIFAAALLLSCTDAPKNRPSDRSAGPNLVLVTIDTLRADHLGAYGYAAAATPHLDRLAAEGIRFDQTATVAPLTLPAHASILTGQYPFRHGVRDNHNFVLSAEASTLQEILSTAGYTAGAFVGAFVLRAETGMAQGFGAYTDFERAAPGTDMTVGYELQRVAGTVVEDALAWIRRQEGPFFSWVHLFDPHLPYTPPAPYDELYRDAPYDGEIAYVDEAMGTLIKGLEEAGHGGDTLVVVVADHGEGLGDHGEERHAFFIYDETLRVPLILWAPGALPAGVTVMGQTSVVDLLPTFLALLGVADPEPASRDGVDLNPLIETPDHKGHAAYAEAVTPLIEFGWSELRAVRADGAKLIAAPRPELYDLRSDPGETQNLYADGDERLAGLRTRLEAWTADDDLTRLALGTGFVDEATLEGLRSLGYVGGRAPMAAGRDGAGLDPKDKVADFEDFQDALRSVGQALAQEDWTAAEDALGIMESRVPGHHLAFFYRGRMALLRGDPAGAVGDLEHTLRLAPAHALAYTDLASAYETLGEKERAIEILRPAMTSFPEDPNFPLRLGSLLHESGRFHEALEAYLRVQALEPDNPRLLANLGHVHFVLRDYDAAADALRQAMALEPGEARHPFQLGLVEKARGRSEVAREWFRQALEVDPGLAAARRELVKR